MSWFDTAKFSKYAKTALKQAQKNIDKVLEINDDDDLLPKKDLIAEDLSSNQRTSTPKSSTYIKKESESFFDSFLGGESSEKLNNASSKSDLSNTDISNDGIDTSKHGLKDRLKGPNKATLPLHCNGSGTDGTNILLNRNSNSISNDSCSTISNNGEDKSTNLVSSGVPEIEDDPYQGYSYSLNMSKEDGFDDIDLTDDDSNATDNVDKSDGLYFTATEGNTTSNGNLLQLDSTVSRESCSSYSMVATKTNDDLNNLDLKVKSDTEYQGEGDYSLLTDEKGSDAGVDEVNIKYSTLHSLKSADSLTDIIEEVNITNSTLHSLESTDSLTDIMKDEVSLSDSLVNVEAPGESIDNIATTSGGNTCVTQKIDDMVSLPKDSLCQETIEMQTAKTLQLSNDTFENNTGIVEQPDETDELLKESNDMVETSPFSVVTVEDETEISSDQECNGEELVEVTQQSDYNGDEHCPLEGDKLPNTIEAAYDNGSYDDAISNWTAASTPGGDDLSSCESDVMNGDKIVKDNQKDGNDLLIIEESDAPLNKEISDERTATHLCTEEASLSDGVLEKILKISEDALVSGETSPHVHVDGRLLDDISMSLGNECTDFKCDDNAIKAYLPLVVEDAAQEKQLGQVDGLKEQIASLTKEVDRLQDIVEARELKMVELSKENISFQESVAIYKSQIAQLEEVNKSDDEEMENLRQEFTKRIAECDSKCQTAIKERDQYKEKYVQMEAQLRQSANEQISVLTNSLLEKEETIKDLLNEGEELSRKELESNNRIKKLRIKLKEVNSKSTTLTEQNEAFECEVKMFKEAMKDKELNEKRLEGEVKKLEGITDSQEDEVSSLKEQMDDMEEKYRAMESTLQNAYGEISKLNLEKAQKDSEAQEAASAVDAKLELEMQLKELEKKSKIGKEELLIQLEDLQAAYSRLEQQLGRREDELKREIEDLHKRLEHGENRNLELSQSVTAATRPLLRQIENLQNSFSSRSDSWERVEKNLTDRLISLQDQLALALEKERAASEVAVEAKAKLKALEGRQNNLKDEKTNLQILLENEVNKCKEIENEWKRERSSYESKILKLKELTEELQDEKNILEDQLTSEGIRHENECLRMTTQLSMQQHQSQQQSNSASRPASRSSSIGGDVDFLSQTEPLSHSLPLQRYLSSSSSFHEGFQKGENIPRNSTTASIEHLKCILRSREGEVFVLQEEIKSLEKTKASLAQELVSLANKVEDLESSKEQLEILREEHADLKSRYDAVLQMYGEKAEEADELRMDLEDVKNMYRQQIQELCGTK